MNIGFKKLLESVKETCPDLITEEVYDKLSNEFDAGIAQITSDASQEGQAIGFKEGYDEGKRVAAEQAKAEFDQLVSKLDADATEKLKSILEMLDDDHTQKLQSLYDFFMSCYVPRTEMQEALDKQDADYAEKLSIAYEAVCTDHAKKLEIIKEAMDKHNEQKCALIKEETEKKYTDLLNESIKLMDEEHTSKLEEVTAMLKEDKSVAIESLINSTTANLNNKIEELTAIYESKLADSEKALELEKERKVEILAESVEKYLNYALETNMPKKELISEQKYIAAMNAIDKITDLLKVNAIIQESKDDVFQDYEKQLSDAKNETNKLINEKIELTNELNKKEAQLVLESKVKKCPPAEARFLREYFKKANSSKIIEESIEEARASFKRIQAEKRSALQEEVKQTISTTPSAVVTESAKVETKAEPKKEPETQVISESNQVHSTEDNLAEMYAKFLTKINK